MRFFADLHIHSKYSRATSRDMDVENLNKWAKIKGIKVLGTGDFTHPLWIKELRQKLEPAEPGLFKIKKKSRASLANNDWLPNNHQDEEGRFLLSSEISCIYSKNNRTRKIHIVVLAPDFSTVEKINTRLGWIGNLKSDGRPILGLDAKELAKIVLNTSQDCFIIPAHIYTPWFSLFGANSGFDSLEECFEEYSKYIYAGETGLSSDPPMSWLNSSLDKITLVSNSDAHCVHPDTNIYTINGKPIPIKDLNPHKALSIDFDGSLRQTEAKISKLHKLPSPSILYKIITRAKEIITTQEHRFFVLENEEIIETEASKLKKGDLVACLRRILNKGKSRKLPYFAIDHKLKILPKGIDHLKVLRIKNKKFQKDVGKYIGVKKDCIWIFEKHKVKTSKESFIDKYCEFLRIDRNKFKEKFLIYRFPLERFPKFTNEKFCQILGYILGDGGIEHSEGKISSLSFTDKDLNLLNHYQNLVKEVFNIKGRLRKKKGNSYAYRYPSYLAEYLCQIDSEILVSSLRRRIPNLIFSLPKKEIAAFLKGLFDAEGTNTDHSIQISMSSLILIKEVQTLLMKFGINSNIYHDFEKNKKKWRYKISIYGQKQLRIFNREIGFNSVPKKEKLLEYLSSILQSPKSSFVDPLPVKNEILRVRNELAISYYDIPWRLHYHLKHSNTLKRGNVKEFIKIFLNYLTKAPSQEKLIIEKLKRFADSDIIWESVQETKKIKSNCKYVYDLTVPNYKNYIANGFITHNSPSKIGREANVFDTNLSYAGVVEAIKNRDPQKFLETVEFFPEEGKYHYDGHRNCQVCLTPQESRKIKNICPQCGKPLTIGVLHRVNDLADRKEGENPAQVVPFRKTIPLEEIIAEAKGMGVASKAVREEYKNLIKRLGSEFKILLEISPEQIERASSAEIAEGVSRVRQGKVNIEPGYDGEFGRIKIFKDEERGNFSKQASLF